MLESDIDDAHRRRGNGVATDSTTAASMLVRLEDSEARRLGVRVAEARASIARRVSVGIGTLRNIRHQRRKTIPAWLMNAIRAELVRVLQHQIMALENDVQTYRQTRGSHRDDDLVAIETQLAQAKETLRRDA